MEWWAWLLIILAILLVIGLIVGFVYIYQRDAKLESRMAEIKELYKPAIEAVDKRLGYQVR